MTEIVVVIEGALGFKADGSCREDLAVKLLNFIWPRELIQIRIDDQIVSIGRGFNFLFEEIPVDTSLQLVNTKCCIRRSLTCLRGKDLLDHLRVELFKIVPVVSQIEWLGRHAGSEANRRLHDVEHINDIPQFVKPQLECGQLIIDHCEIYDPLSLVSTAAQLDDHWIEQDGIFVCEDFVNTGGAFVNTGRVAKILIMESKRPVLTCDH
jgi:hypothetical protein